MPAAAKSLKDEEEISMTLDTSSPLWAVLADWVKVILTLPDPPPDSLVQLNDVAILAAISALTERMSTEAGAALRQDLPSAPTPFTRPRNPQPDPAPKGPPDSTNPTGPGPVRDSRRHSKASVGIVIVLVPLSIQSM